MVNSGGSGSGSGRMAGLGVGIVTAFISRGTLIVTLLLLIIGGSIEQGPGQGQGQGPGPRRQERERNPPCTDVDLTKTVSDACSPCDISKKEIDWLELVLRQRADLPPKYDTCFNSFPLGTNLAKTPPEPLTKGMIDKPDLKTDKTPRGFVITKLPFFRYNTAPKAKSESGRGSKPSGCSYHKCPYSCLDDKKEEGETGSEGGGGGKPDKEGNKPNVNKPNPGVKGTGTDPGANKPDVNKPDAKGTGTDPDPGANKPDVKNDPDPNVKGKKSKNEQQNAEEVDRRRRQTADGASDKGSGSGSGKGGSPAGKSADKNSKDSKVAEEPQPEDNLDIGNVKRYFGHQHGDGDDSDDEGDPGHQDDEEEDIDLQLIEWPGRINKDQETFLSQLVKNQGNKNLVKKLPKHCQDDAEERTFLMSKFHRESSKFLHYPCNKEEGMDVSALGFMSVQNREADKHERDYPHSTLYLSFEKSRIFHASAQPIYISSTIKKQLAKPVGEVTCQLKENPCNYDEGTPECKKRQSYFVDRGEIKFNKEKCDQNRWSSECRENCRKVTLPSDDLVTILDFTFVQGRLILGMRCGIVVVDGLLFNKLDLYASTLITSNGKATNTFKPVTKIASNHCCNKESCRRTLVAAYPSTPVSKLNADKEIYVSFDLGTTFSAKLIADFPSALNLMYGMYKMYNNWLVYDQLLENPDEHDLYVDGNDENDQKHLGYAELRKKPHWDSLSLGEKELKFLFGETPPGVRPLPESKKLATKYFRLQTKAVQERVVRFRKNGWPIELDVTPDWLKNEIEAHRATADWYPKWTDQNCDSHPECRENFEDDPAVKYFLNASRVIVKTPKRKPEDPFCDQIVSLAVLEEEDSLYALCVVGFGDFRPPEGNTPYCSSRQDSVLKEAERKRRENDKNKKPEELNRSGDDETSPPTPEKATSDPPASKEVPCNYLFPNRTLRNPPFPYNKGISPTEYFAIFTLTVREKLPLVLFDERRSERLFTCKPIEVPIDWSGCKTFHAEPDILRVPNSITLLVKNCKNVLYYSPNGGRTIYNTEFYAHHSEVSDDSDEEHKSETSEKKSGEGNPNPVPGKEQPKPASGSGSDPQKPEPASGSGSDPQKPASGSGSDPPTPDKGKEKTGTGHGHEPPPPPENQRQLLYRIKSLDVPPQIMFSPLGNVVLMTMRNKYAYGLLGVNKEFRMIVGNIFNNTKNNILSRVQSTDYVFPSFTTGGQPFFGVALKLIYSHNPAIACDLYHDRNAMRLVHMDAYFYEEMAYYYNENLDMLASVREKGLGIDVCHTLAFSVTPKNIRLDVGETDKVEVKAYDVRPNIPLSILSSEEKSILVDVELLDRDKGEREHLTHDWDINIQAIRNFKPRLTALVESFFGLWYPPSRLHCVNKCILDAK